MAPDRSLVAVKTIKGSVVKIGKPEANVPIDSLDRCITGLHNKQVETDGTGFRALGADVMADRLLGAVARQLKVAGQDVRLADPGVRLRKRQRNFTGWI